MLVNNDWFHSFERIYGIMSHHRKLCAIVVLAIGLCILVSTGGAHGEDKNTGGLHVATIDLTRVQAEYKALKNLKLEVDNKQETLTIQMQAWQQNALLAEADQKTLADLNIKEKSAAAGLTAAEKTNQSRLIAESHRLNDDYQRLQGTAPGAMIPGDKALLQDYVTRIQNTEARANAAKSAQQADLQNKLNTTVTAAQKSLHDALKTLAREKGFNLVLSSDIAPYADYDCTDDAIKLLNK